MKLRRSAVQSFGFVVATSFLLATLSSCGGAARLAGRAAGELGEGAGRNLDELGQVVGQSGDEAVESAVRAADSIPVPHVNPEAQSPEVIKIVRKSDNLLDVIVDNATDQAVEVTVDCVTGLIMPSEVIDSSQQDNFVQSVCSQAAGDMKPDSANQQLNSEVRIVNAGEGHANLRSALSTEVATIAQISNGTSVKIIGQTQNSSGQLWYEVEADGQVGWMFSGLLD